VRIKWVNHASFILDTGDARILTDPWIVGTAFNNGWELLAPTVATTEDFATVTHIWFSHEHPDHFHPESLKKIAAMINPSAVLILYQDTLDHRVAKYCRKLGFAVRELPNRAAYKLSDRTTIIVGTVPFYDSWIYIRHGDKGILNLNDCVIKDRKALESIRKACGPIDVLCVQFGYANWEGNPEDEGRQKDAAAEKIRRASMHLELLCPKFIILFASFIRFAHVENSYLNKHNTKLRAALAGLSHHKSTHVVVLRPGDEWDCESPIDAEIAVRFYEELEAAPARLIESAKVDLQRIHAAAENYQARIRDRNSGLLLRIAEKIGLFPPIRFWITDHSTSVVYSHMNGLLTSAALQECDVALSSDSLLFLFRNDFGFDTLSVNGRFRATGKAEKKMFSTFGIGSLNNTGRSLSPKLALDHELWGRVLKKIFWHRASM
jgi:UDP-MurNAc hydroxylase